MKHLYLLRHAVTKSSHGLTDRERALTDEGRADAKALGRVMAERGYAPDFIFCSPALRTRQTLEHVLEAVPAVKTENPEALYNASRGDLFHFIQSTPKNAGRVLVVAHNPGIHELAAMLGREGSPMPLDHLMTGYRPGTLSVFDCPCESWAELQPGVNDSTALLTAPAYEAAA